MSSQWEVARDSGFSQPVLRRVVGQTTELRLAPGVLDPASEYWLRTRHRDTTGLPSAWSNAVHITTAATAPDDQDGNGTLDEFDVRGFTDSNGNGIDDATEGICDLLDGDRSQVVGLQSDAGQVSCFSSMANSAVPDVPADGTLPYGLFNFRVDGLRVDPVNPARVTIRVHLPGRPTGTVKWFKYDPATGELFQIADNVRFERNTALVELEDGGIGDFDGVVNGVIVDPSGPLSVRSSVSGNGGGSSSGGGSIGFLLPGVMAAAGLIRRRRRLSRVVC